MLYKYGYSLIYWYIYLWTVVIIHFSSYLFFKYNFTKLLCNCVYLDKLYLTNFKNRSIWFSQLLFWKAATSIEVQINFIIFGTWINIYSRRVKSYVVCVKSLTVLRIHWNEHRFSEKEYEVYERRQLSLDGLYVRIDNSTKPCK